ncbi:hypothetical protein NIES2119_29370 [[Phormidium ambiguum] IAM M-71]|uniref:NurA domain-containing protein n=1 Tax=[Phormidium ambiguum] IAM M-71 TaxID=454136 RepID=A0A1U7I4R0_9CYAN|nr:DNA double-strand break repair nuclease NurA [Phormidium ambiguum]OKH31195.1 hypothetical protein NIES2119_29370 [Phormidium ambiguum IAM M-71]
MKDIPEQLSLFTPEQLQEITQQIIVQRIQQQPHILIKLQENALTVAENLQGNYFENTAKLVNFLRQNNQKNNLFKIGNVGQPQWSDVQDEVVTFIDGGVGQVEMASPVPVLIRVGSYKVKTGEHDISKREEFAYYPIIFGDLEGGSKERKDFVDIVRITSELLGAIAALERTPDLKVLMIHGPLVYMMSAYAGHSPFTEKDIDLFLENYPGSEKFAQKLKEDFWKEAELIYPKMTSHHQHLIDKKVFEPLTWIAFLYRRLIKEAKSRKRKIKPLIMGVIERNELKEFSLRMFGKIFDNLRKNNQKNYFNDLYGRNDLNDPKVFLDRLNYKDTLLLSMLLETQEFSQPWEMIYKYQNLPEGDKSNIILPNESYEIPFKWSYLKPDQSKYCFPKVTGFYLKVSDTTEPVRIEVFSELGKEQITEAAKRVFLYSQLLPGYGFPIGLDMVDKYAKVPNWMTDAYAKQIQYHLGVSLQSGQIKDKEMRKMLIQSIYMTKRDWLFRPNV